MRLRLLRPPVGILLLMPTLTSTPEERSKERYRRAMLTTFASLGAQGVAALAALFTVRLALNYLGTERYGLWMTVTSLVAIIAAADLGIGNGLLNAISKSHGKADQDMASRYVSSAFFMLFGIAAVVALLVVLSTFLVSWPQLLNVRAGQVASDAKPTALVLLGCSILGIPLGIASRVQMGYQEGFLNVLWQGFGSVIGLIGLVMAIALNASLPWLVMGFSAGPVLGAAANLLVLVRRRDWLRPRWRAVRKDASAMLLRTGLMFAVLQAVVAAAFMSDNLIVDHLFGPDAVAEYSVHAALFGFVPMIAGIVLSPFWPAYGEAIARGDIPWVREALLRSVLATLVFVGGASVFLLLTGSYLMELWVGSRIVPSVPLMVGLTAWAILSSVGNATSVFLNGAGVLRLQVVLAMLMGIAAIAGKILGGQIFGLPGVVWGTAVAYAIFSAVPIAVALPRILDGLVRRQASAEVDSSSRL